MDDYRELTNKDFFNGTSLEFMKNKILDSDIIFDENGYDEFGTNLDVISKVGSVLLFIYKNYFKTDSHGIENIPEDGPGLIVSNHAPILPFDAAMIWMAGLVALDKPRFIRTIVNKSIPGIPGGSVLVIRGGQIVGCDENVRKVFENQNLIVVFPTGAEGDVHTIFDKYKVDKFTVGFMEYALKYRTPIIPTCVTGSEEAAMTLGKLDLNFLGFKHLPLTPLFPWLGLLGLVPLPSKFDIYFDSPIHYYEEHPDAMAEPKQVRELVDGLRSHIQGMLNERLGLSHP
jgi:1-acyl-sn-glycerol-3-phosphate acyltransferase